MAADQQLDFDLEGYAANYTAFGKVNRLLHIARQTQGSPLELESLRLAADQLKQGANTTQYTEVINWINGRLGPRYVLDSVWVQQTDLRAAEKADRLENELNGYKTNLLKEAIRVGHTDLADFYFSRGDLQAAFKCYLRTRDYCTTSKHILSMCLNVIRVNVAMHNYMNVTNYVQKAETTPDSSKDAILASKFKAAGALALIDSKRYKAAARKLTEVSADMGNHFSEVLAAQDVALYGGLCALASFDRPELKRHVIDNLAFNEFLELCPEVRELIFDFNEARYATCLARLARLTPQLRLDRMMCGHITQLSEAIRSKAIVQYTQPYQTVHLPNMAAAFSTDATALERELATLIQKGDIAARIDSHNKILIARHANQRTATFSATLKAGEDYLNSTAAAILRANLLKHDLVQRQSSAGGGGGGGGGGTNAPTALASNGPAGRAGHHFGPEKGSRHFHPLGAGS